MSHYGRVLFAYVDETGDTGETSLKGASSCFALGCVLVDAEAWPDVHEATIDFRRRIRTTYKVPMRAELKANYLIRSSGALRPLALAPAQRGLIYRAHLSQLSDFGGRAFSVVVDKAKAGVSGRACFDMAWETLFQRLERTSTYEKQSIMLFHDDGENDSVRKAVRKARRHLVAGHLGGGGSFTFKARRFVEDPSPRNSEHSYLIQIADMVAYAGWRTYMAPSAGVAKVVPANTWSSLGDAVHSAVNRNSMGADGTAGVVLRR